MKELGRWARRFPWGEACLWFLFIATGLGAASESNGTTMTLSGLFLFAAIGVRATREPKVRGNGTDS